MTKTPLEGSAEDLGGRFEQIGRWLQLKEGDLFKADLDTLKALVMPQIAQKVSSGEISLRGDFASILLGGTEIKGSCQHIEHPSKFSRGTVGYLLNGHLMLGCCDSMEKWTVRTLLRPVLLQQKNGVREVVLLLREDLSGNSLREGQFGSDNCCTGDSLQVGCWSCLGETGRGRCLVEGDLLLAGEWPQSMLTLEAAASTKLLMSSSCERAIGFTKVRPDRQGIGNHNDYMGISAVWIKRL